MPGYLSIVIRARMLVTWKGLHMDGLTEKSWVLWGAQIPH